MSYRGSREIPIYIPLTMVCLAIALLIASLVHPSSPLKTALGIATKRISVELYSQNEPRKNFEGVVTFQQTLPPLTIGLIGVRVNHLNVGKAFDVTNDESAYYSVGDKICFSGNQSADGKKINNAEIIPCKK